MALRNFHFDAELTLSFNDDHFLLVAEGNYLIVNFKDLKSLERVLKNAGAISFPENKAAGKPSKKASGNPLQKLQEVNDLVLDLGLVVDIRVGSKTYVSFGAGKSAKITAAAIFGKIGSFFSR